MVCIKSYTNNNDDNNNNNNDNNNNNNDNNNNLSCTIDSLSVVVGTPWGRVDVDVAAVEAEGLGLQGVEDISIQDSDSAHFGVVGNTDGAKGVVGDSGHGSYIIDTGLKICIHLSQAFQ